MAVRTKQLTAGRLTTTSPVDVYTCPDGETAILKSLAAANLNASTATVLIVLVTVPGIGISTMRRISLAPQQDVYEDMWIVLHPAQVVRLQLTVAVGVNFWLSGTELEGVAD